MYLLVESNMGWTQENDSKSEFHCTLLCVITYEVRRWAVCLKTDLPLPRMADEKRATGPSSTGLTKLEFVVIILYEIQMILRFFNLESFTDNFWCFTTGYHVLCFYSLFLMEAALSTESSENQDWQQQGASPTRPGSSSFSAVLRPKLKTCSSCSLARCL